jgi:CheY-like chemotaxis protein
MAVDNYRNATEWAALGGVAALLLAIFIVDLSSPLGYADWALYLLPVGVTLVQHRRWMPFVVAAAASLLVLIGWYASPPGPASFVSAINRGIGVVLFWGLAVAVWQVLSTRARLRRIAWLQRGEAELAQRLLGEHRAESVADAASAALCGFLGAEAAVVYRLDGEILRRLGGHAFDAASSAASITVPEGLLGQVVRDRRVQLVSDVPEGHLPIVSALGASLPRHLLLAPLIAEGAICGVIELGFARRQPNFDDEIELLGDVAEMIGVEMRAALYRERLEALLAETQQQREALQAQQEELRVANEELEEQSQGLRDSQARLEVQQVSLEQSNVQLEERNEALERQKQQTLQAQQILRENALKLEAASRYKSEFLANMSHELRTPLNSSLILSKLLADNKEGTLSAEQVRYAQAIHASNNDLLLLINDILDLSKIEAGRVVIEAEPVALGALLQRLRETFEPLARQKELKFSLLADAGAPETLHTDPQRLQQILKNLLANAIKFTPQGEVGLRVMPTARGRIAFEVRDSGIGIAREQQQAIFEAFHQADGSTSRKFGGTGLGLSISRELAQRLGGEIRVDSEPGRGSTFTLEIPLELPAQPATAPTGGAAVASVVRAVTADAAAAGVANSMAPATVSSIPAAATAAAALPAAASAGLASATVAAGTAVTAASAVTAADSVVADDRGRRVPGQRLILAVEDDVRCAQVLYELAHEMGFDCVVAPTAAEGLRLVRELQPSGILLDVGLPDESGLGVLERLKRDPATRHVPVHMMSVHDRSQTALELGAIGYVLKPAARDELAAAITRLQERLQHPLRHLLIVEDDRELRESLCLLLGTGSVEITAVGSIAKALERLRSRTYDCMVLDLTLPDGSGYELLEQMAAGDKYSFPPVIVYTGHALSRDEEQRLRRYSKSIIVKGARSPERLLDEVTLFLHSVESQLPPEQQRLLRQARRRDTVLEGRRILLVEDDVRNIFALSSVFEPLGAVMEIARNGREAVERLQGANDIDLVLMDIMMPEMDGLTAMRHIRAQPSMTRLPIIALTAKAMPDDRDQCLAAGANDYVAKPIDIDRLVSLCQVWIPK